MPEIKDLSVGRKMANYLNSHSLDTGPAKKKKKYLRLHMVTYLCQFMGQNSKILGVKKIRQRFWKTEHSDFKPHQTPEGVAPPKMVPPYSLGTCPPKTPSHFDAPLLLHREKNHFLKTPDFGQSTRTAPGQKFTYVKIDQNRS